MQLAEHTLVARGRSMQQGRPKPQAAGSILRLVAKASRDAANMGFRNASRVRGRRPDWLRRATDIRFTQVTREGEQATRFHFLAPKFGPAASEIYEQQELSQMRPDAGDTVFDLWGDVLDEIASRERNSDKFDTDFLRDLEPFGGKDFAGIDSIELYGDRLDPNKPPLLDDRVVAWANELHRETPLPNRARVAGKLDMIRHHDRVFTMVLANGQEVRGVWCQDDKETLTGLWGQKVVAEGRAVYRPSGSLLRLEAEAMHFASDKDSIFSSVPLPTSQRIELTHLRQAQTKRTGMGAIYGKWPGDESEEEILAHLKELG